MKTNHVMRKMIPVFLLLCFQGHTQESNLVIDSVSHKQISRKLLIVNSFDANSIQARKNKKALFDDLADSLKYILKLELDRTPGKEIIVIPEFINNPPGNDSIYFDLMNKYSATKAIVIKDLNVYFEQTGVAVTKESDGKKRVASYNINADVTYLLYNNTGLMRKSETKVFEFFTERSVFSGMLAGGPDIVGKSKHAFRIVQKNAEQYLREIKFDLAGE